MICFARSLMFTTTPFHSPEIGSVASPASRSCSAPSSTGGPLSLSIGKTSSNRPGSFARSGSNAISASHHTFDVVVIGAGTIGLSIARQLLLGSYLSVAVVDKAVPCSGATGAGQGYIWMGHQTPGSDIWDLSMRSHKLWVMLAENLH